MYFFTLLPIKHGPGWFLRVARKASSTAGYWDRLASDRSSKFRNVPKKIRNSPEVKSWLAKHRGEFSLADFGDHATEFFERLTAKDNRYADMYAVVRMRLSPHDRRLFDLYIEQGMKAREIAARQHRNIQTVYRHIKYAKKRLQRAFEAHRENGTLVERRAAVQPTAPIKTLKFQPPDGGPVATARLVFDQGVPAWIDDNGKLFDEETQDLLDSVDELAPSFEVLDVEET